MAEVQHTVFAPWLVGAKASASRTSASFAHPFLPAAAIVQEIRKKWYLFLVIAFTEQTTSLGEMLDELLGFS